VIIINPVGASPPLSTRSPPVAVASTRAYGCSIKYKDE
jgi:hypothetical protein